MDTVLLFQTILHHYVTVISTQSPKILLPETHIRFAPKWNTVHNANSAMKISALVLSLSFILSKDELTALWRPFNHLLHKKTAESNSLLEGVQLFYRTFTDHALITNQSSWKVLRASCHRFHWLLKSSFHNVHLLVTAAVIIHRPLQYTDTMCQLFQRLSSWLSHMYTITDQLHQLHVH